MAVKNIFTLNLHPGVDSLRFDSHDGFIENIQDVAIKFFVFIRTCLTNEN